MSAHAACASGITKKRNGANLKLRLAYGRRSNYLINFFSIVDSLPKPHIPNPVPLFTGRQDELAEITKVIADESTRLVNIHGRIQC